MENPFKFGTIVEDSFFTDRVSERQYVSEILNSANHLILISPRRYGKSSLVHEVLKKIDRPSILINLQSVTNVQQLAGMIIRHTLSNFPLERIKYYIAHFRFVPTISVNPLTDGIDISFQPGVDAQVLLEDAFAMIEKVGERKRMIVVFDEFQEILSIDKNLDKQLRALMQVQQYVNYVMLGSQESMMLHIFEKKKSPFYHFGVLMRLQKIPYADFMTYISTRLQQVCPAESAESFAKEILEFTQCHSYYAQQLSFQLWSVLQKGKTDADSVKAAIKEVVNQHDFDYERLWQTLGKTDKRTLQLVANEDVSINHNHGMPTSTLFSSLKRLTIQGFLLKEETYKIDDPFFKLWINAHL